MDIEQVFISKILTENVISKVLEENLPEDVFEHYTHEWDWIKEQFRLHGAAPPLDIFQKQWPDFVILNNDSPISYYVSELRKKRITTILQESMHKQAELFKANECGKALEVAKHAVILAEAETRPSQDINLIENTKQRDKEYREITCNEGITGLPFPWACLNEKTLGIHAGEIFLIAARNKVGKSWLLIQMALHLWRLKHSILIISKEMSSKQMVRRADAINARLAYSRFRSGQLHLDEAERWEKKLKEMDESDNLFMVVGDNESTGGVSSIEAKVQTYNPDVLYIDGLYLLADDKKAKSPWERLSNISYDLKRLAQRANLPIVVTHQFNLQGLADKGDENTLKNGDISLAYDGVMGLYSSPEMVLNKERHIKLLKNREGEEVEFTIEWDLDLMKFDVYKEGGDYVDPTRYGNEPVGY